MRVENGWPSFNADAFPCSDWLEKLVMTAEKENGYDFSSRQIQANQLSLVDGAGDAYHISGLAWRRCYNKPVEGNGIGPKSVFSACPTAALYLRNDFLQAGGFDEDYFSYFEDVDLGFRPAWQGRNACTCPKQLSIMWDPQALQKKDFSVYYGYRNMIWTFFKNMPSPLIWFFLPAHIFTVLFFILYLTFRGQGKVILRAIVDAVRGLPDMLAKRKEIQRNMTIRPLQLLEVMSTGLFGAVSRVHEQEQKDMNSEPLITISIVSHGDAGKIRHLLASLEKHEPDTARFQLILTDNLKDDLPDFNPSPWASLQILRNKQPRALHRTTTALLKLPGEDISQFSTPT
ncbi:MAG: hypothetical protein MZV64_60545 [Ignavibacteriales bacterium]|nr:hypothetical protein [Ignavibacteriales bacterium]